MLPSRLKRTCTAHQRSNPATIRVPGMTRYFAANTYTRDREGPSNRASGAAVQTGTLAPDWKGVKCHAHLDHSHAQLHHRGQRTS